MNEKEFIYIDSTPYLSITFEGTSKLGFNYNLFKYKITSRTELTDNQIRVLRSIGLLGYGQEFFIRSKETVEYDVSCVVFVNGVRCQNASPINPWSSKPYQPIKHKRYEYIVEDRVDSTG